MKLNVKTIPAVSPAPKDLKPLKVKCFSSDEELTQKMAGDMEEIARMYGIVTEYHLTLYGWSKRMIEKYQEQAIDMANLRSFEFNAA